MAVQNNRGVAVVSVLIAAGIVIVLAVIGCIAMPAYGPSQEQGRQASCFSQLHAVGIAIKGYRADFGHYPGPVRVDPVTKLQTGGVYELYRGKYLSNARALICPDDKTPLAGRYVNATRIPGPAVYSSYTVDEKGRPLYNYYGLDNAGRAVADRAHSPLPPAGVTGPRPGDSTYPALFNPQAPDETIVVRCVHHEAATGKLRLDMVLHLGGDVEKAPFRGYQWMVTW
jgi:hypothetical protein